MGRCGGISASSYHLSLEVDFARGAFSGSVRVTLAAPEHEIRLNSVGLEIERVESEGKSVPFRADPKAEELLLGPMTPAFREVTVHYRGQVSTDSLTGFYRSRHGEDGRYFFTTHLAPTGARRLFPCIDHPAAKATFAAEVTTDASLEAVFNTEAKEVRPHGDRKTWVFPPTPKMSTYLLYLGIGRFDTLSDDSHGLRVSVKSPPGTKGSAPFALENGHRSVQAYASYYNIPYPLPKLDLVSVQDFAAGAMENWGAITFREAALLADETTSTLRRQYIAEVVAHEIAHQWFGNLVTMEWWNDIWLNESFATLMSFKMVDRFYQNWDTLGQFLVRETGRALKSDALDSTHPVDVPVKNVEEVTEIFDDISYGKGASVLRMLESYIGEDAFRQGVGDYLRAHAYGNAKGNDLWAALEKSSGAPVRKIIDPWIHRPGHPLVTMERRGTKVHLSQRQFRLQGGHPQGTWPIPLTVRSNGKVQRTLFETPTTDLEVIASGDLSLNADSVGFYRVLYDTATYDDLRENFSSLPNRERWSLIRDLHAFLLSGDLPPDTYRSYLEVLRAETDPWVVFEAAQQALYLNTILGTDGPLASDLRAFLSAQSERLGVERAPEEAPSAGIAREMVNLARAFLDPQFAHELAPRFREWTQMDPDLREPVAVAYARSEGSSAFDPLVARARASTGEGEMEQVLMGLMGFHDGGLVARALDWSLGGEISRGMLTTVGTSAVPNPEARSALWEWFRDHLDEFERVYKGTAMLTLMVERILPYAALGRQEEATRVLTARPIAEAERGVRKGLELLRIFERLRQKLA